jgi:hypothetical protein
VEKWLVKVAERVTIVGFVSTIPDTERWRLLMHSRLIRFILVGALLLQMGCAKTLSTIRPEPRQELGLSLMLKSDYAKLKENDSHLLGEVGNTETYYTTPVEVHDGYLIGCVVIVVAAVAAVLFYYLVLGPLSRSTS